MREYCIKCGSLVEGTDKYEVVRCPVHGEGYFGTGCGHIVFRDDLLACSLINWDRLAEYPFTKRVKFIEAVNKVVEELNLARDELIKNAPKHIRRSI